MVKGGGQRQGLIWLLLHPKSKNTFPVGSWTGRLWIGGPQPSSVEGNLSGTWNLNEGGVVRVSVGVRGRHQVHRWPGILRGAPPPSVSSLQESYAHLVAAAAGPSIVASAPRPTAVRAPGGQFPGPAASAVDPPQPSLPPSAPGLGPHASWVAAWSGDEAREGPDLPAPNIPVSTAVRSPWSSLLSIPALSGSLFRTQLGREGSPLRHSPRIPAYPSSELLLPVFASAPGETAVQEGQILAALGRQNLEPPHLGIREREEGMAFGMQKGQGKEGGDS